MRERVRRAFAHRGEEDLRSAPASRLRPRPGGLFAALKRLCSPRGGDAAARAGSDEGQSAEPAGPPREAIPPQPQDTSPGPRKGHFAGLGAGLLDLGATDHTRPKLHPAAYVGSVIINLLALGLPLVILQVYDRIVPKQATDTLLFLMLGLTAVLLIDGLMRLARAYIVGWAAAQSNLCLAGDAVARILRAPPRLIEADAASVHVDRLNALDSLRDFHGGQTRLLLLDLPFVLLFLGLVALIGGALVVVPVALFAILGVIVLVSGRSLRAKLEQRAANDDKKYDFIIETLNGIQTVKSMAMEALFQRRFERLQTEAARTTYDTITIGNAAQTFGNIFASITMVSVVTVGAMMVIDGTITIGTLAACTLLSGRSIQPVLRGLMLWTQMQGLAIARRRVAELFELPPAPPEDEAAPLGLEGAISLHKVSFTGDDGESVYRSLDIDIGPGEIIGITGKNGSGKSVLLKLVSGELSPSSGEVLIDGHRVGGPEQARLRREVAYLAPRATVFQGTILDNITMFGDPERVEAGREAARLIGLEGDIHKLPEGYDTPLSEGIADALPAGTIQRVAIARALARRPMVLLFDEANATLDVRSDTLLREGLAQLRGRVTILLVSNRPSMLAIADRVVEAGGGELRRLEAAGQGAVAPGGAQGGPAASPDTEPEETGRTSRDAIGA